MVPFFLLGYESQFYYITVLEVKCEMHTHKSNYECPFLVTYMWGGKERKEVKIRRNKSQTLVFSLLYPPVNCFLAGSFW